MEYTASQIAEILDGSIVGDKDARVSTVAKIEEATEQGEKMVVLCSPVVRSHFKRLTEKFIQNILVISHSELSPDANIKSLGTVRL